MMTDKQLQIAKLLLERFQFDTRIYGRQELRRYTENFIEENQWQRTVKPVDGSEEVTSLTLTDLVLKKFVEYGLITKLPPKYGDREDWYELTPNGGHAGKFRVWYEEYAEKEKDRMIDRTIKRREVWKPYIGWVIAGILMLSNIIQLWFC